MGRRRTVLGRGLDALIPTRSQDTYRQMLLDDIVPGGSQPRSHFDDDQLVELTESIKRHGILQPLIVSGADGSGKHRLIVGERRWQAARQAGLEQVPVIERDLAPEQAMVVALVENLQRADLEPLEQASAYQRLMRDHSLTQEEIADRVGKSRSAVANSLRLLSLPTLCKEALEQGLVSEGHARALLGLHDASLMEAALRRIVNRGLSVRDTEALVASMLSPAQPTPTRRPETPPRLQALEDRLRSRLGTKVSVLRGRKRGRIIIEYYSDEDLETLSEKLLGG